MSDTDVVNGATRVLSPAKINWTLQVAGKRPDGFHDIASLVSIVTLYDELEVRQSEGGEIVLECDAPGVPTDDQNLVCRAAKLLAARANVPLGLRCRLTKRIPVGGGLGGGSSNGAAALIALNRLWRLNWTTPQLAELAAELGSDVSLFLEGGSAVIEGRGERVRPTHLAWKGWIVLLMPGLSVSTAAVYRAWRPQPEERRPVEMPPARDAIAWMGETFNMLEAPAIEVCPELGRVQCRASELAGRPVRISGSGSTLFTAFDEQAEAAAFGQLAAERIGIRTQVVRPVEQA